MAGGVHRDGCVAVFHGDVDVAAGGPDADHDAVSRVAGEGEVDIAGGIAVVVVDRETVKRGAAGIPRVERRGREVLGVDVRAGDEGHDFAGLGAGFGNRQLRAGNGVEVAGRRGLLVQRRGGSGDDSDVVAIDRGGGRHRAVLRLDADVAGGIIARAGVGRDCAADGGVLLRLNADVALGGGDRPCIRERAGRRLGGDVLLGYRRAAERDAVCAIGRDGEVAVSAEARGRVRSDAALGVDREVALRFDIRAVDRDILRCGGAANRDRAIASDVCAVGDGDVSAVGVDCHSADGGELRGRAIDRDAFCAGIHVQHVGRADTRAVFHRDRLAGSERHAGGRVGDIRGGRVGAVIDDTGFDR